MSPKPYSLFLGFSDRLPNPPPLRCFPLSSGIESLQGPHILWWRPNVAAFRYASYL